jgi:predicted transcriptional regulator
MVSLRERHALDILAGRKRFELRRIRPEVVAADYVLIYATCPVAALVGRFRVGRVLQGTPRSLWSQIGKDCGLTRAEFLEYFEGRAIAHAIEAETVESLRDPLPLSTIRARIPAFTPPQSYWYLNNARAVDAALLELLAEEFEAAAMARRDRKRKSTASACWSPSIHLRCG